MELVKCPRGGSLDLTRWALIRATDHSPETTRHRLSIASGVASGMAFLHDRGYIHADLKPGNVWFFDAARVLLLGLMFLPPIQFEKGYSSSFMFGRELREGGWSRGREAGRGMHRTGVAYCTGWHHID
jgi:serine/threonine protein kinase